MQRKTADLQNQRPFYLNRSLVVAEILIADYPDTIFSFLFRGILSFHRDQVMIIRTHDPSGECVRIIISIENVFE